MINAKKVLSAEQIRALDTYTIQQEPIPSLELMERASRRFCEWFTLQFTNLDKPIWIFCGSGNNGGDGLAIARLLQEQSYSVHVFDCQIGNSSTEDRDFNKRRLPLNKGLQLHELTKSEDLESIPKDVIIIDALFGSGLSRPIEGFLASIIARINASGAPIVAVDIPSGLFPDKHSEGPCIHADYTLTFELPKLAFFFPENVVKVGQWTAVSIGLHQDFLQEQDTHYYVLDEEVVAQLLHSRKKFDHKGTFGHALLICGSYGKMGAAVLAGQACLRAGVGLLSMHVPKCGYNIIQTALPEAMVHTDPSESEWTSSPDLEPYTGIGIGCGIGQTSSTKEALKELLQTSNQALVLDADALNIIGQQKDWLNQIPEGSILTPHPKEFERLFGKVEDSFEKNLLQRAIAQRYKIVLILKGAHTAIALPDGNCYFNTSGNPGMATAGSGDSLSGILAGLLAQGYTSNETALIGVYLHGKAGDLAAKNCGMESMIASDITAYLGAAYQFIHQLNQ